MVKHSSVAEHLVHGSASPIISTMPMWPTRPDHVFSDPLQKLSLTSNLEEEGGRHWAALGTARETKEVVTQVRIRPEDLGEAWRSVKEQNHFKLPCPACPGFVVLGGPPPHVAKHCTCEMASTAAPRGLSRIQRGSQQDTLPGARRRQESPAEGGSPSEVCRRLLGWGVRAPPTSLPALLRG